MRHINSSLTYQNGAAAPNCDMCHNSSVCCGLLQLGGTIGDIEGMPFIEAFRQFQFRVERENFCCVLVSLILQVSISRVPSKYSHTHTHPFNGPFSGTTRVGLYQKGKTNLDFTEARHSEW